MKKDTPENPIDFTNESASQAPQPMREAMFQAELGDDSFFDDPTGNQFLSHIAQYLGAEQALLLPSNTMANLLAVKLWARPGEEVMFCAHQHTIEREAAAISMIGGVQILQLSGGTGVRTIEQSTSITDLVKAKIKKEYWMCLTPPTKLILIQNPTFSGDVWPLETLKQLKEFAGENGIKVHVNGNRMFNALATYQCPSSEIGKYSDTIAMCMSKNLCCPIGSVIVGSCEAMEEAKKVRKLLGGGMKQTGLIGAAGIYALNHLIPQIKRDNETAQYLGLLLSQLPWVKIECKRTKTNIVHFELLHSIDHPDFQSYMARHGIKIRPMNQESNQYRLIIHRSIREQQCEQVVSRMSSYIAQSSN